MFQYNRNELPIQEKQSEKGFSAEPSESAEEIQSVASHMATMLNNVLQSAKKEELVGQHCTPGEFQAMLPRVEQEFKGKKGVWNLINPELRPRHPPTADQVLAGEPGNPILENGLAIIENQVNLIPFKQSNSLIIVSIQLK